MKTAEAIDKIYDALTSWIPVNKSNERKKEETRKQFHDIMDKVLKEHAQKFGKFLAKVKEHPSKYMHLQGTTWEELYTYWKESL